MSDETFDILLVEDHPGDVKLTRRALKQIAVSTRLHVAVNGFEALDFLYKRARFMDAVRPALILLDLNMPGKDGRAVLQEVSQDLALKTIPIVVLTTSAASKDVKDAYQLCANSYHTKPVTFPEFVQLLDTILTYWINTATTSS